jgi:signal transduction histidine kinase/streptogramin lyase
VKTQSTEHYKNMPGHSSPLPSNRVTSFYEDRAGNMWVGTNGGLSVFDPLTKTFKSYRNNPVDKRPLDYNVLNVIREDSKGRLWLGTNGGLNLFDVGTETFINYQYDPNDSTSLSANNAYSLLEDRSGRLWIGTESGLNLFENNTQSFRTLHYEREFPKDVFYSILEDNRGRLWSSTNSGLLRFTPASDFAPEQGIWGELKAYTIDDGIPNNEFSLGSQFKGKDGRMYFGTGNGFMFFHPDSLQDDLNAPPVFLTDLEIFNKPIIPGKDYNGFVLPVSITEAKELILSHRESVFTIKFSALAFANAAKNKYAYQLEGFDKDWNYTDAQRRLATYTNLDPGTYTFRVRAANRDGTWNENGATLNIIITPPWWRTWWFRIVLAISSLGAVILVFIVRTSNIRKINQRLTETVEQKTKELKEKNQVLVAQEREITAQNEELLTQTSVLEEKNKELERARGLLEIELQYQYQRQLLKMSIDVQEMERKRIAQDLHDELGAVLSIARMQLVQMQNNNNSNASLSNGLLQAQTLTESALSTMRRISHELMPPQLEKYGLIKTLEALAGQINATKKINIGLTTPEGLPRWSMPLELGLYRIVMEMINNTLRHAGASNIHIQLLQTLQNVVFTYSDDGKGLPKDYIEGHGFKNVEARTNALGGTIEVRKDGANGFNATIYFPQTFFEPKPSAPKISSEDHAK